MSAHPGAARQAAFEVVCPTCGTVAVTFERAEGAFDDTPIFCGSCGRLRGVMGAIRKMVHEPAASTLSQSGEPGAAGNESAGAHHNQTPTDSDPPVRYDDIEIGHELDGRTGPPWRDPDREC